MADCCEAHGREYPDTVLDTCTMNRVLRHRLRNLCAGMTLALDSITDQVEDDYPRVVERTSLMLAELQDLQRLTERMDLLFDELPAPQPLSICDILASARAEFAQNFPFCALDMGGPEHDTELGRGSWWAIAIGELLANAGEAAGADGAVAVTCVTRPRIGLTVRSAGSSWPERIPLNPPEPFRTTRGRHDGIGLAIVQRICDAMGASMAADCGTDSVVTVTLAGSLGEGTNG